MTLEIDVGETTHVVSVEHDVAAGVRPGRFRVVVRERHTSGDARAVDLDARRTASGVSIVYAHDGRSVDVAVTPRAGGERFLQLPHVALTAFVGGRGSAPAAAAGDSTDRGQRLTAPMPGRVVRVLVRVGDEVTARQGLVVIEAMKMENQLVAARPGKVRDIAVSEGRSVEAGHLLITLD
jgi:biotin carboxyl carrier protein